MKKKFVATVLCLVRLAAECFIIFRLYYINFVDKIGPNYFIYMCITAVFSVTELILISAYLISTITCIRNFGKGLREIIIKEEANDQHERLIEESTLNQTVQV